VNRFNGNQQICTRRKLLGGTQYGEAFPHALEVILGEKSIAWIRRNADKSGRVLQDLAEVDGGLGKACCDRIWTCWYLRKRLARKDSIKRRSLFRSAMRRRSAFV
jgi:hypothetical protein